MHYNLSHWCAVYTCISSIPNMMNLIGSRRIGWNFTEIFLFYPWWTPRSLFFLVTALIVTHLRHKRKNLPPEALFSHLFIIFISRTRPRKEVALGEILEIFESTLAYKLSLEREKNFIFGGRKLGSLVLMFIYDYKLDW